MTKLIDLLRTVSPDQNVVIKGEEGYCLYEGALGDCDDGRFSEGWVVIETATLDGKFWIFVQ